MNSKEIFHITSKILYIAFILIFLHCASSQPLSSNSENDDDTDANSLWAKPSKLESEDTADINDYFGANPFLVYSDQNSMNQPNSSELVRRANFWKRANFWRKRANFWR